MDKNFLLKNKLAQELYHNHISKLPIIDYHNHLSVKDILDDRKYDDIAELWLVSDPYKHRAMRICGVDEKFITGNASNYDKFCAWCSVVPKLIGNPLYHWSNMEIKNVFGIDDEICEKNAGVIWEKANLKLKTNEFSAKNLLKNFSVEYAAPCYMIYEDIDLFNNFDGISPSLRADGMYPLTNDFISKLQESANIRINNFEDFKNALKSRINNFDMAGCRFADHALDHGFMYVADDGNNDKRFKVVMNNSKLDKSDSEALFCEILRFLGEEYANRGWTMQLHIGALRNTGNRLRKIAGPAGGFAGIGTLDIESIASFLDELDCNNSLPKTILFTLNPSYNEALSILSGTFSENGVAGKIQQGAAWWWCDHIKGIKDVLESMSSYSAISTFYGMTTDSRSLLSFVRHDYFRRIFCNWICEKVENEEFITNFENLVEIAENVCYYNVKKLLK